MSLEDVARAILALPVNESDAPQGTTVGKHEEIRRLRKDGWSVKRLAQWYGVSLPRIYQILLSEAHR